MTPVQMSEREREAKETAGLRATALLQGKSLFPATQQVWALPGVWLIRAMEMAAFWSQAKSPQSHWLQVEAPPTPLVRGCQAAFACFGTASPGLQPAGRQSSGTGGRAWARGGCQPQPLVAQSPGQRGKEHKQGAAERDLAWLSPTPAHLGARALSVAWHTCPKGVPSVCLDEHPGQGEESRRVPSAWTEDRSDGPRDAANSRPPSATLLFTEGRTKYFALSTCLSQWR